MQYEYTAADIIERMRKRAYTPPEDGSGLHKDYTYIPQTGEGFEEKWTEEEDEPHIIPIEEPEYHSDQFPWWPGVGPFDPFGMFPVFG